MVRIVNGQIVQDGGSDAATGGDGASGGSPFGAGSSNMLDAIMNGNVTLCGGRVFSNLSILGIMLVSLFLFGFQGFVFVGIGFGVAYYMEQRSNGGGGSLFGSSGGGGSVLPTTSNNAGYSRVATLSNPSGGSTAGRPPSSGASGGGRAAGSNIKGMGDLPKPPVKC